MHLDSGTDVVIVKGDAGVVTDPDVLGEFTAAYNTKYDWEYAAERDGPPTRIEPVTLLSWHAAGPAGRDGFPRAARWQFR